jgi:hypothetical protein
MDTRPWPVVLVVIPEPTPNVCSCGRVVRRTRDGLRLVRIANPDCTSDAH